MPRPENDGMVPQRCLSRWSCLGRRQSRAPGAWAGLVAFALPVAAEVAAWLMLLPRPRLLLLLLLLPKPPKSQSATRMPPQLTRQEQQRRHSLRRYTWSLLR
jgi:hypothetical protein